ncbi:MAG: hypothetical protein LC104_17465 [Bacteroidales bacterium]|nr:hypothetical protein [Bacteroidales bacterium]
MPRCSHPVWLFAASVLLLSGMLGDSPEVRGQAKPTPPAVPKEFPILTTPAHLGAKVGDTVDLTLTGTNLANVTGVWTSFPATIVIPSGQKDAKQLKVKLTIPANTPIGLHTLRVATEEGVSNSRPFIVDDLPSVAETTGKNKSLPTAQPIPLNVVVTGAAEAVSSDFFKVPVTAGKPLTVDVLARRFGSPLDPVILLHDGTGRELGGVYADDTPGLQSDCRLVYTPRQSGEVIIELRDSIYRGGGDYVYRMRVGSFPGATTAYPLMIQRGKSASIRFTGPDASGARPVTVTAPADLSVDAIYAVPHTGEGMSGWPVPVLLSEYPQAVEAEPNGDAKTAMPLPVPGGVSAVFAEKSDIDTFRIAGKKGVKVTIQVLTYAVNAPTEVYLRVLDAQGKELLKSDPTQAGVKLDFTPPADGPYDIVCEHLNYLSGPNEVYHLSVVPTAPDFTVTLGLDQIDLPQNGMGVLPITGLTKLNGFKDAVKLTIAGTNALAGSVTIPAGGNPVPTNPLWLPITVKPGTQPGPIVFRVLATAQTGKQTITQVANHFDATKAAFGNMANPPMEITTEVAAAVTPSVPFTLSGKLDKTEVAKGSSWKATISAKRDGKFTEEIQLTSVETPTGITAKLKPIPKGKDSVDVEFTTDAKTAVSGSAYLRGTAKVAGKTHTVVFGPIALTVTAAKPAPPAKK